MIEIHELVDARGLLARAVLTQGPDFTYNPDGHTDCFYTPSKIGQYTFSPDAPQLKTPCLIGVALQLAGLTDNDLRQLHGRPRENFGLWENDNIVSLSRTVAEYFTEAQEYQDAGHTWGESYEHAEASLEENEHLS